MRKPAVVGIVVALLWVAAGVWAQAGAPEKKLIAVGWDMPNAERFRVNLEVMETTPFQGCSVRFGDVVLLLPRAL